VNPISNSEERYGRTKHRPRRPRLQCQG
jgi:hypothetical protein